MKMTAEALLADQFEATATRTSATSPALLAVIRAARDGDERAFEEIMLASERRVSLLAWRILGDIEEVKEATQETFLRVFRHLRRFDEQLDFFGWLFRIAVNVCRDIERRRRRWIFAPFDAAMTIASNRRSADDTIAANDDVALLTRAIDALPAKERLAVILREVEELSTEEVAVILGSSPATVRVQVSKARAKLRVWIEARRGGAR
ncbi:MAG: sigma-70 family RNA polymerase sigma factor [Acidobacteria bacterium]|nr:sigma-70 family RNA polymerase sigma factor [Acidobacteriota bacterium]MBV9068647.1 sigma-70 family RNA polymerase sigma factor [Acidobacteriota bacterium]MBV9187100.1 sigma-70 family RNA polymerase sigma factor [Acidobacteriota bacterium]